MNRLVAPTGQAVKHVPWKSMLLLEHFAHTWGRIDAAAWGIHCSKCGTDVQAGNGITDRVFTAKCGCSEYYAERPDDM